MTQLLVQFVVPKSHIDSGWDPELHYSHGRLIGCTIGPYFRWFVPEGFGIGPFFWELEPLWNEQAYILRIYRGDASPGNLLEDI